MLTTVLRYYKRHQVGGLLRLLLLVLASLLVTQSHIMAQAAPQAVRRVRTIYPSEWGIPNEAGLTYSTQLKHFFILKQGKRDRPASTGSTIVTLTPYEEQIDALDLDFQIDEATNLAFDDGSMSLYLFNSIPAELIQIRIGANNKLDPATLTHFDASTWGIRRADGMDVDVQARTIFLLDRNQFQLKSIGLTSAGPDAVRMTTVDLSHLRTAKVRGLALNPANHHLYTASKSQNLLYELTPSGQVVSTYALNSLALIAPRDMVFAPSSDLTDLPDTIHMFLIDSNRASDIGVSASEVEEVSSVELDNHVFLPMIIQSNVGSEVVDDVDSAAAPVRHGEIVEIALGSQVPTVNAASTNAIVMQLIRTINTAAFSPPSPDPSGMTYLPFSNTLLMSDGEVEETVSGITLFAGATVWEMTLSGSVVRTANISRRSNTAGVVPMTNEPTGMTWSSSNGHYYVTDDDAREVYDLNPGSDNTFGTADDTWTSFDTEVNSNLDPEGITYDVVNNRLFVADGVNAEVYQYTLAGAPLGHFDVQTYGIYDPESVEYNTDSDTLFVLGNTSTPLIVETSKSGSLLQTFDVSAASALAPAGLAYGPASNGSGLKRFYISARGVDNNSNPNENDGKIYEMTAPQLIVTPTNTPVVPTATATVTPTFTATVTPTFTATITPTFTATITPTFTATITPTFTATITPTFTATITPTFTATITPTFTATITPTFTATITPTFTATITPTFTATITPTFTATITPTFTAMITPTFTATITPTFTATITPTFTATITPTFTATITPTFTATITPTFTATVTPTFTATDTPVVPTSTPTHTPVTSIIEARVAASSDDAEENGTGIVNLTSSDLELVFDGSNQIVGLRFNGIAIPANAAILNAYVQFQTDEVQSEVTTLTIWGQAINNAPTFASTSLNLSSRSKTSASTSWSPVAWQTIGETGVNQRTPNMATVLQEIVNRPGWASGNSVVLLITGTGHRTARAYNGIPATAPLLHVEFTTSIASTPTNTPIPATATPTNTSVGPTNTPIAATATPTNTPTATPGGLCTVGTQSISVRIGVGSDDAEQLNATGAVDLASSDLELINDGGSKPQTVGLRFPGIAIPNGAIIASAIIEFEVDELDSVPDSLLFQAQAADNPPTFAATANNVSSRPRTTASVAWNNLPAWTVVNAKQQTPNLAALIQEIVNRSGWASGNALAFIVTGSGERTAEAVEGEPPAAPLLTVQFCAP